MNIKRILAAAALLALGAVVSPAAAQKGGGTKPTGTIYFSYGIGMSKMNADGTGKTALPAGVVGHPSRLLRAGKRWFLRIVTIAGETYPNGNQRRELFAFPDDGGASVQLTNDPSLQPLHHGGFKWMPGESLEGAGIAGFARRWNPDGTADPANVGLYTAQVVFDGSGVPTMPATPPAFLVSAGVHYDTGSTVPWPEVGGGWDFSPDADQVVVDHSSYLDIRIVTVATGDSRTLYSGNANSPAWSPNGARIAFHLYSPALVYGAIATIAPDGSGYKTNLKALAGTWLFDPYWSPDSAHLLYTKSSGDNNFYDVFRVGATGGSQVNLTSDLPNHASAIAWR